ncbi:carbohydrate ABC transporter permease [Spiroplasma culicicola]|uniref:sn-glycerol-3-phosphate ABC transporter permease n=1 Tax=Spiroplasma culicicola AES-1 TaxID=1276246 RepID=W6A7Q6_9MOLU|nr:sugar ABC transporter permease [Spiroplasma culicicola]AHI52900.1 sn-glycerol-3-phosphate ABC transporter permease [Spiroplasma culicicola AES-1]
MRIQESKNFEIRNDISKSQVTKKKKTKSINMERTKFDFLYQMIWITPALAFLFIFSYYSIFIVFRNGFNSASRPILNFEFSFINFKNVANDASFQIALRNSLLYSVVVIPISLTFSMTTAKLLSNVLNKKLFSFLQSLFFLPYVTSAMAISMSFAFIFSPDNYGLINQILLALGFDKVDWTSKSNGIILVMIYGVWRSLPFEIIMFTATFLRIDKRYYHAAAVDGVPKWKQFWKISIPRAMPMIVYMITTGIISSFKVFPLGLFGSYEGAAQANAQTVVFYIFDKVNASSTSPSYGKGGAASIILMTIILAITIVNKFITNHLSKKYR